MMLTLSLVLAACGGNGDETYEWKFITEEVDGQVQYEYAEEFAKRMKDKSDGQVNIEVYEFGGLGSEVDQVDQLQKGVVQLAIMSPGFTGNMVKEGQIFALHFLFPDSTKQTQEILNTSEAINVDLRQKYEEHDITPLAFWTEGFMQWTSNEPISEPSDFENFQMRVQESPLMFKSYEAYGADPQAMSWGELYTALERETVEGQENPIFFIYDASFHEVQDYMTLSKHNNYVAMTTVNSEWYNGLPDDIKEMVDETVEEMRDWIYDEQERQNAEFLEQMKNDTDNPTEIVELTEEQREAFRELALPVRDFYKEEVSTVDGAILEKLQEEIKAVTGE
ncbi:DctP family TRAP transporter solute-binding subunit [Salirhabdus salicampi]|uniref:DctP family TRAP transporter solute-binding subunit n=1 Tax=Salirhabdus salicampi TaxID=476102 RepID=UPI0020C586C9|nr:DctP family TRAP transporter solute-binding subunit [Salirhabdus salicampi]MCP8617370.1 DctP family TRAP transporter solute-binding subunit [Salirhabdus salicampi]